MTPGGPWNVIQVDTLELGPSISGEYRSVLVCVDCFTRWAEVVPLHSHNAANVAAALVNVCARWGPPEVVRCDNGTELINAITTSLYAAFGVKVNCGAARHPQSQGGVERFNQTLLTLIRKTMSTAQDWMRELDLLLFYYRVRPHSATGISPFQAMNGWMPRKLIVPRAQGELSLSAWTDQLVSQAALIRDYVEEELSDHDFIDATESCPFDADDLVMLRRSDRRQKRLPMFERGWVIRKVLSPSSVVICRSGHQGREKIVNVELLKLDVPDHVGQSAS